MIARCKNLQLQYHPTWGCCGRGRAARNRLSRSRPYLLSRSRVGKVTPARPLMVDDVWARSAWKPWMHEERGILARRGWGLCVEAAHYPGRSCRFPAVANQEWGPQSHKIKKHLYKKTTYFWTLLRFSESLFDWFLSLDADAHNCTALTALWIWILIWTWTSELGLLI